jgi:uncharacterized membrane protein YhiD involved in acid resistance
MIIRFGLVVAVGVSDVAAVWVSTGVEVNVDVGMAVGVAVAATSVLVAVAVAPPVTVKVVDAIRPLVAPRPVTR